MDLNNPDLISEDYIELLNDIAPKDEIKKQNKFGSFTKTIYDDLESKIYFLSNRPMLYLDTAFKPTGLKNFINKIKTFNLYYLWGVFMIPGNVIIFEDIEDLNLFKIAL